MLTYRRPDCPAATRGIASFEVIRTFDRLRPARLNVYLAPLLEVAVGPANLMGLHKLMLELQRDEAQKHLRCSSNGLMKAVCSLNFLGPLP